jgi:amino acid transporter
MENLNKDILGSKGLQADTLGQINDIAKWTKILTIVSFVSISISLISAFVTGSKVAEYSAATGMGSIFTSIIVAAISLALNIILYKSSQAIKAGIDNNNQGEFAVGMQKMATYFKIIGIIVIIALCIFALLFVFGLIGGLMGGFN